MQPEHQKKTNVISSRITGQPFNWEADPVPDAVVSVTVKEILVKLGSVALNEIKQNAGVRDGLNRLGNTLSAINAVLLDAEEQQSTNQFVKNWLHDLKDVTYDIEDMLDSLDLISTPYVREIRKVDRARFNLEVLQRRIISQYDRFAVELEYIRGRLEDIACNQKPILQKHQPPPPIFEGNTERQTHSFVEKSRIFGREHDSEWIINCLLTSSSHEVQYPRVIPVTGIGGMGKTTLAQLVFNDPRVVENFDLTIWAYISEKFDLKTVIANIIQSVTGEVQSHLSTEALQERLCDYLAGKTFLLVLDDVWISDLKQWLQLKELLAVGARGSTVIVTTREERVASITGTTETYKLKELSVDHSWSVFVKCAFDEGEEKSYPWLVHIGKSIVRKCKGVPLAVKTLGNLLKRERYPHRWIQIEKSELWKIRQGPGDILTSLKRSFDHIPYHLRLCFASCAIFRKGCPLYRSDLINLWMGHGLLQLGEGSEDALDVGYRCFDELLSRSLLQLHGDYSQKHKEGAISQGFKFSDGKVECVEMHDLMHDLVAYVTGQETTVVSSNRDNISSRARHLVWDPEDPLVKDFPTGVLKAERARTFASLNPTGYIHKSFLNTLISNFRCLRVLIFRFSNFEELPDSIGNLKHLRYLDLRENSLLKLLPESICSLLNLAVLDVGGCGCLKRLPEHVHKLTNLRSLMLSFQFNRLPKRDLEGWGSLQVLELTSCQNLESLSEEFGSLKSLRVLVIRVCDSLVQLPNSMRNLAELERITIHSCRELDLKGWEGLCDLRNLQFLDIDDLPSLLEIPDMGSAAVTLRYFRISRCERLMSLPESPKKCISLVKLHLYDCPELRFLPRGIDGLHTLQELCILRCPELRRRYQRETGDYWHLIAHVPEICIDDQVIQSRDPSFLQGQAGEPSNKEALNKQEVEVEKEVQFQKMSSKKVLQESPKELELDDISMPLPQLPPPPPPLPPPPPPPLFHRQPTPTSTCRVLGALSESNEARSDKHEAEIEEEDELQGLIIPSKELDFFSKGILFLLGEDYEFEKDKIIQLWMAAGFISNEPMEINGATYFEKLVSEEYILLSDSNSLYRVNSEKVKSDLSRIPDKSSYLRSDSTSHNNVEPAQVLHVSVLGGDIGDVVFRKLHKFNRLRTLLFVGTYGSKLKEVPVDLFLSFESLFVLDLSGTNILNLPSSVGKMIHLRYLDLSWTFIERLPEAISRFKWLQTFKLKGCSRLHRLPREMKRLAQLRHLDFNILGQLASMPEGIGVLKNLRTLSAFLVGSEEGYTIRELKELINLTGELCIARLENVHNANDAEVASLSAKKHLKKLDLRWSDFPLQELNIEDDDYSVLKNLRPHSSLEELQIRCYGGTNLPSWIADESFDKLSSITLFRCEHVLVLPSMQKLPSLEYLELISLNSVRTMDFGGEMDHVAFPKLQKLIIEEMLNLETWVEAEEGDFPCLVELIMKDCPKLPKLPMLPYLSSLKRLELSSCPRVQFLPDKKLSTSLEFLIVENCPLIKESCSKQEGECWDVIKHVRDVWIDQEAVLESTDDDSEILDEADLMYGGETDDDDEGEYMIVIETDDECNW